MAPRTPLDDMLHTLTDVHRRRLLVTLLEQNPHAADDVRIPEDVHASETPTERFRVRMLHLHLPHLEDAGFIRWKKDEDEVAKGPNFKEIRPLLELMDDHADELPSAWI